MGLLDLSILGKVPGVEMCDYTRLGGTVILISHPAPTMDSVTKMNKDELEKWKSFQQRFKVEMGQFKASYQKCTATTVKRDLEDVNYASRKPRWNCSQKKSRIIKLMFEI